MEPARVKVYGLFSLTKRRYLGQAAAGVIFVAILFVVWWFGWPPLRDRLMRAEVPASAFRDFLVAVLNNVPWILLGVLVYKAAEVFFVLRAFARRDPRK